MNASSPMPCLVDEGNEKVIALRLLQRRLYLVALYWHPTISLSISFQLKRPTRPIDECSSLPTACICELSFPHSFRFRNISHWKQSLFAWCQSIMRRPISCDWISAPTLGMATSAHAPWTKTGTGGVPPEAPAIRLMMMLDKLTTPASSVLMPRVVAKDHEKLGVSCERAVAKAEPWCLVGTRAL